MEKPILFVTLAIAAYLVGSANLTILACRALGIGDIRQQGSRNPGATNLLRVAGARVAAPVLILDFAKAAAAIWAAQILNMRDAAPLLAIPLILGNIFPVFHRFRGGKAVAATVGAFIPIAPVAMLLGGLIFLAAVLIGRRVSLGSLLMVTSYPIWILIFGGSIPALIAAGFASVMIVTTHRENIERLFRGEEPEIGGKNGDGKSR